MTGRPFLQSQRYVYDLTQEIDPATGLRWYSTVVLIQPRQTGKSTGTESFLTWSNNRRPWSNSLYMAQTRDYARTRLLDEWEQKRLRESPATRGRYQAILSNGREAIVWANGSRTKIAANNSTAGHSLTLDGEAILDEAFAHPDLTSVGAISPTMVTCPDPQLWIMSTLGDGTDGLLQHFQDVGSAAIHDPTSRVCFIEWSAEDGPAVDDVELWKRTVPTIGETITIDGLRQQLVNLGAPEFDRAFLCRRRVEQYEQRIPAEVWATQLADVTARAPFVLAPDIAHDRSAASIAVAASTGHDRQVVMIVDRRPGTSWLIPELRRLQAAHRPAGTFVDPRSPAGSMIASMRNAGVHVTEIDTAEFTQAAGAFYDGLVHDGDVVHIGQPALDLAVAKAATRPLGDAWAWNRRESPVDISPLCAATIAVFGHRKLFPAGGGRIY